MEDYWVDEFYNDYRGFRVFIGWKLIQEYLNHRFERSNSRFTLIMAFNTICFYCVRYEKSLGYMHAPYMIKGQGTEISKYS